MSDNNRLKGKRSLFAKLMILVIFLIGFGIFVYPTVSDIWNRHRNEQLINSYRVSAEDLSEERTAKLWEEAEEYNKQHTVNTIVDAFNEDDDYVLTHPYDQLLDPNGDGLMGSIEIPKIDVNLPVYHGLGTDVLEKGAGHVEGTSLPIGGESTHCVLAGHRGLPTAKLFTDLDQMEEGDIFLLHILDRTLAYRVDRIKTVLPEESSELSIIPGEDHVTLVTCTPYGVNTHRLLIRGIRTDYTEEIQQMEKTAEEQHKVDPFIVLVVGAIVFLIIILVIYKSTKNRNKDDSSKEELNDDIKRGG